MSSRKGRLYSNQDEKCFYCRRKLPIEVLNIEHIVPSFRSTNISSDNLVLCCQECNLQTGNGSPFHGIEFSHFITQLLDRHKEFRNVGREVLLSSKSRYRVDILVEQNINGSWKKVLIELKAFSTFTSARLHEILNQLKVYREHLKEDVKMVFAFPGVLPEREYEVFNKYDIEVWDRNVIARKFKNEIAISDNKIFRRLFSISDTKPNVEEELLKELRLIPAGRDTWSKYQKHIEKTLIYLFGDILSNPITELPDEYGVNKRDFILRNYCEDGFWKYLREKYCADFIVIDAKNYTGQIKKEQILQISNYLKLHGTGLFAIIISRNGDEDAGAYITRREKWERDDKMIIILDDSDIEKMILAKASSNSPEEIIKQRVESFRLGL